MASLHVSFYNSAKARDVDVDSKPINNIFNEKFNINSWHYIHYTCNADNYTKCRHKRMTINCQYHLHKIIRLHHLLLYFKQTDRLRQLCRSYKSQRLFTIFEFRKFSNLQRILTAKV